AHRRGRQPMSGSLREQATPEAPEERDGFAGHLPPALDEAANRQIAEQHFRYHFGFSRFSTLRPEGYRYDTQASTGVERLNTMHENRGPDYISLEGDIHVAADEGRQRQALQIVHVQ